MAAKLSRAAFNEGGRHLLGARIVARATLNRGAARTDRVTAAAWRGQRGLAESPVTVQTLAGPLSLREEAGEALLQGPAELIGGGEFYFHS